MDAATPPEPPPKPPAYVWAATDMYPRTKREEELCAKASTTDWAYLVGLVALNVGSIALDAGVLKYGSPRPGVRTLGPATIGVTWGALVGGMYLATPKCSEHWITYAPPEGDVRADWPMAAVLAVLAGITAPITVGIETGNFPLDWSTTERVMRVAAASAGAVVGALLPYALPPKTWSAAVELRRLRASADAHGAFVGYELRF